MKASVCTKYGPPEVLQLREVKKPTPKDDQVLIRNHATTVESGDVRTRSFDVPPLPWVPYRLISGITKPRKSILGMTLAGEVEEVGKSVTLFGRGDRVFGSTEFQMGCHAEYVCLSEKGVLAAMPSNMSYPEAAAVYFGGTTALHFLKKGDVRKGQKVLIYGASGAIGTFAVQLAHHLGAEVTGVCSTANVDLVRSLGAAHVIDYTREDFPEKDESYDVIFDTVGKSPFSGSVRSLKPSGIYLRAVHMTLSPLVRGVWTTLTSGKKVIGGVAVGKPEILIHLKELIEAEKIRSVIDRRYPLEDIVEAHRYVDTGHKKGSVVITFEHSG